MRIGWSVRKPRSGSVVSSRHGSAQSNRRLRVRDREALLSLVQQFVDAPSESVILLSVICYHEAWTKCETLVAHLL